MDVRQVSVVCPSCAAAAVLSVQAGVGVCPRCGHPLGASGGVDGGAAGAAGANVATSRDELHAADELLTANLRRAFEFHREALRRPGPCRLRSDVASSARADGSSWAPPLPVGSRLGDFEILGELGRGGMGVVYRARQVPLGREVALKVLPGYARHRRMAIQRFRTEAQAAARLHHTNIVSIYAQGEQDGHFHYAMELVDGVGLDTVIHSRPDLLSAARAGDSSSANWLSGQPGEHAGAPDGRPPPAAAGADQPATPVLSWTREDYRHLAALLAEVADALECAHRHGVIHRDVKPHNLLLGKSNRLHLTDFGLARLTDAPHLTVSGEVMGTPSYLSPEQVRGNREEIDHRTDIYSLGATLYEMLTRRRPFDGGTREEILSVICTAEPVAPRRLDPSIPVDLETVCLRAMDKMPARRHPSAAVLAEDLWRFSEGRPIRSRRPSRTVRAARWVARRKALAAATATVAVAVALCAGLAWSASAARHREAQRLLRDAYEQLAYADYHAPDLVAADIERAAALGADADQLHRVRALTCLGATDQAGAIAHLSALLQHDPTDLRALYLLAWAQWRNGQQAAAQATFWHAEQQGPPTTADAWFFRGLAIHFDEPSRAIESYRQAIALRARGRALYPQAVLHLARARNQQLYTARNLDAFPEAVASLRQLVEHQQYGAYPNYLLSIAHRLAAEIYSGIYADSGGTRGDSLVADHYSQALEWARRGQQVEPTNDRPITAEAEALESMGRYPEAIEARTRAIAAAVQDVRRWEGYHYRWRLHYWTGAWEAALADLAAAAGYDPQCRFYAHVYPALILAEMGDLPAALDHARALPAEAPDSSQAVLWSATCLRLLGRPEEAATLLADRANAVDFGAELVPPQSEEWMRALYAYCRDGGPLTGLDALAAEVASPRKLWGQAHFHAAARRLAKGDRTGALAGFRRAYRCFDGERRYTYHAKLICTRMQQDPTWPSWIAQLPDDTPDSRTRRDAGRPVTPSGDEEGGT